MRHRGALLISSLAMIALAAGCITPGAMDLQVAENGRAEVEQLLDSFAEALRQRDTETLKDIVSPHLKPQDAALLKAQFMTASLLVFYKDYEPDFAKALAGVGWQEWQSPIVTVPVPYTDLYDTTSTDVFKLHHREDRWYLVGFEMKQVRPGELLNPQEKIADLLRTKAAELMESLRTGNYMDIYYQLPQDATVRHLDRTWMEKMTTDKPESIMILSELARVQKFTVLDWPEPDEAAFVYVPGGMGVYYNVYYVWPGGGINQPDLLHIEFIFMPREEAWFLHQIRLSAVGLPWSQ